MLTSSSSWWIKSSCLPNVIEVESCHTAVISEVHAIASRCRVVARAVVTKCSVPGESNRSCVGGKQTQSQTCKRKNVQRRSSVLKVRAQYTKPTLGPFFHDFYKPAKSNDRRMQSGNADHVYLARVTELTWRSRSRVGMEWVGMVEDEGRLLTCTGRTRVCRRGGG